MCSQLITVHFLLECDMLLRMLLGSGLQLDLLPRQGPLSLPNDPVGLIILMYIFNYDLDSQFQLSFEAAHVLVGCDLILTETPKALSLQRILVVDLVILTPVY